jgi:hypothetical protein
MSALTQRPRPSSPPYWDGGATLDDGPARPLAVSALLAALAVAACGRVVAVALAVIGWLASSGGTIAGAAEVGVAAWLTGHGAPPRVGATQLGLVPLGVPPLVVLLGRWAGRWAVDTSAPAGKRLTAGAVGVAGLTYGALAAGLALSAVPSGVAVDPLRAGVLAGSLVVAGFTSAMVPTRRLLERAAEAMPAWVSAAARGAVTGLVTLLGLSTLTVLATVAVHAPDVWALGGRLAPGLVGAALLLGASLLYLPNAVLWAAAYLLGPGFEVGAGSEVSPSAVVLGPLPAYPPLAALPAPGDQPALLLAVLALPLAAGAAAGAGAERRASGARWWTSGMTGAAAGALAGAVVGLLMMAAGGAIGPGRMREAGPFPSAALVAIGTLALGGLVGAAAVRLLGHRLGDRLVLPDWRAWLPGRPARPGWARLPWRHR